MGDPKRGQQACWCPCSARVGHSRYQALHLASAGNARTARCQSRSDAAPTEAWRRQRQSGDTSRRQGEQHTDRHRRAARDTGIIAISQGQVAERRESDRRSQSDVSLSPTSQTPTIIRWIKVGLTTNRPAKQHGAPERPLIATEFTCGKGKRPRATGYNVSASSYPLDQ